jgi:outer membrane assembly lipoprotein YfiO
MRMMVRLCWIALAGVAACGHGPKLTPASQPDVDLAHARRQFHSGDCTHASVSLRRLTFELGPTEPQLPEVHYYLAECYFQTGDKVQAAHEFRQVADQYPTSEYAPLALLRAGDANLRLWRRPELDPTYGQSALAIYQELAGRYPGTAAAARAQLHVQQLREWFAEKDYKNGMFYLKHFGVHAYDSAIIYFKDVIASYPGTSRVPDALMRLVEIYRAINYTDELKETCSHLRRFYPHADGLEKSCPADTSAGTASAPAPS